MKHFYFLMAAVLAVGSGCETVSGQQRRVAEGRLQSELAGTRISMQRMESRIEGLEAEREMLHARMNDMQRALVEAETRRKTDLSVLEIRLQDQAAEQVRIRGELADELSGRIAKIIQSQAPVKSVRTQAGYEHIVKSGETLSEIARAYEVSTAVIAKANNITNPDSLRVGQTLFIPE